MGPNLWFWDGTRRPRFRIILKALIIDFSVCSSHSLIDFKAVEVANIFLNVCSSDRGLEKFWLFANMFSALGRNEQDKIRGFSEYMQPSCAT